MTKFTFDELLVARYSVKYFPPRKQSKGMGPKAHVVWRSSAARDSAEWNRERPRTSSSRTTPTLQVSIAGPNGHPITTCNHFVTEVGEF